MDYNRITPLDSFYSNDVYNFKSMLITPEEDLV